MQSILFNGAYIQWTLGPMPLYVFMTQTPENKPSFHIYPHRYRDVDIMIPILEEIGQDNSGRCSTCNSSGSQTTGASGTGLALWVDARSAKPKVPGTDICQLALLIEKCGVGANIGLLRAESSKVGVTANVGLSVKRLACLVVKLLCGLEVLMRKCILGNPNFGAREATHIQVNILSVIIRCASTYLARRSPIWDMRPPKLSYQ